ncbi:MAG: hypothetical protein M3Z26_00450 [Bacteroidota bacterium]|nr:hypothetical protein [Bacteroidota bacterium]
MNEVEKNYVELLKGYSNLKDNCCPSNDTVRNYHEACKQMEHKMTAKQIIECIYEAFSTPIQLRSQ